MLYDYAYLPYEVIVKVFGPFFNWVICFLLLSF